MIQPLDNLFKNIHARVLYFIELDLQRSHFSNKKKLNVVPKNLFSYYQEKNRKFMTKHIIFGICQHL